MDSTVVKKDCDNCSKQFLCQDMITHTSFGTKKPDAENCPYYTSFKETLKDVVDAISKL